MHTRESVIGLIYSAIETEYEIIGYGWCAVPSRLSNRANGLSVRFCITYSVAMALYKSGAIKPFVRFSEILRCVQEAFRCFSEWQPIHDKFQDCGCYIWYQTIWGPVYHILYSKGYLVIC